ncbi:putative ABC transport system ATP-binding protein [Caldicellulosiruptor bescii]|uniref:ABC transporter related n=2 Tax=Caldicellulosiruptor bescii TaxID=31899 RepID=B9MK21_CALBD|nr:ABC transporter ATP-binding protein [Caldicellulosiruptor bescii]ACM60679.1 ABC transporter related [Caldicellulosiruptor bescii DSM 6725]PBC88086.1 putative ABC transport system ATP-binding protein [Caldicellulosiruptor bescii]PBC91018.1 putative ABC transport system ATP-binding protein [Caldicellulosiruptor bescii]PBD06817.1 putative ABC transport system ATP-binding protein [Caldicellulosiruptor bescii]PBD08179.1 putative ABC transport system ATP-binding protein [Caldicellulosiruptor besc
MFVKVENLSKVYRMGQNTIKALDRVSFELEKGKIYTVIGPSGSGKSTLFNILGGLDRADEGRVFVDSKEITAMDQKRLSEYRRDYVGFVFQFFNLINGLTVYENVLSSAHLSKNPLDIDMVLKMMDVYSEKDKFPFELSGGQQQRVAIARAVVKNPALILCDEPTGALDYDSSKLVLKLLEDVNKKFGTTILIITHNLAISKMADATLRLRSGRLVEFSENSQKISAQEVTW